MRTRITELLGIAHPVLSPGMTYVSNADLVAAVSKAGGLGILAVGHLSPEETRAEIRRVRSLTDKPFGVGVALIMPGAAQNAEIAIEEKVPVLNFSLGKGDWICKRVHAYGGKVRAIRSLTEFSEDWPLDAVINLAGEGIADRPWSAARKQQLHTSRV